MTLKKKSILTIVFSLLIAGAMISTSRLLEDAGTAMTAMYILVAIWFIPWSFYYTSSVNASKQCRNRSHSRGAESS